MSKLGTIPYPFHEPWAQDLHVKLFSLHPSVQSAMLLASQAHVSTQLIDFQQPISFVWMDILRQSAVEGLLPPLVQLVNSKLSGQHPFKSFFKSLIDDTPAAVDPEPRTADAAPAFPDDVTEQESLLYAEDLTLQIGRVPALIKTLNKLVELAPSVCTLEVDISGSIQNGTAFRIGPDMLLTNWHVLHKKDNGRLATAVTAGFGFEDNGKGKGVGPTNVPCDVDSVVASRADDWAIIRTSSAMEPQWPIVKLSGVAIPKTDMQAFIIQHPLGQRKRIGFVRNCICQVDDRTIQYLTDTQEGSSGSPVFNADGGILAIHHAGGRPQQIIGKQPLKKNEGIRISKVLEGLTANDIIVP